MKQYAPQIKFYGLIFLVSVFFYFSGKWGYVHIYGAKAARHFCQQFSGIELTPDTLSSLIQDGGYRSFRMKMDAVIGGGLKYTFEHETKWVCTVYLNSQMQLDKAVASLPTAAD